MKILPIAISVSLLGMATAAYADPIPMSPELKSFLMRQDQQQAVIGMMFQQWKALVQNCPTPQLKQTNVVISQTPTFNDDGMPTSGMWRVVGRVEGCDESRVFNIMYAFTPDGRMGRVGLLPGSTAASYRLQKDALMYAQMSMAKLEPKDCKDIQYTDTKFIGFGEESPSAASQQEKRSWTEEWTVRTCGVTGIVTMKFVPDATGTAIVSSPDQTRQISP